MKKEIERKFLVRNDKFKDQSVQKQKITQGYLSSELQRKKLGSPLKEKAMKLEQLD